MITIKTSTGKIEVKPTIFPDGTSQVWKLGIDNLEEQHVMVVWEYEEERELIWLAQLLNLLQFSRVYVDELYIPYFPYARQDKIIYDKTTFARYTFCKFLETFASQVKKITTLDIHSSVYGIESKSPVKYIHEAMHYSQVDVIVFPDAGAARRYEDKIMSFPFIILDKDRDQQTGQILGLKLKDDCEITRQTINKIKVTSRSVNFLIVDDICDGGMTFIKAAELIKTLHPAVEIDLYVTHGIYSKGVLPLHDAGIRVNYTTKSLRRFRINSGIGDFGSELEL